MSGSIERLEEAAKEHPREYFNDSEWAVPVEKEDLRAVLDQLAGLQGLLRESYGYIVKQGLWEDFLE